MTNREHHPEEAFVGKELESRAFEVSTNHVQDYFEGLKLDSDWYEDSGESSDKLLPSMILVDAESMAGALPFAAYSTTLCSRGGRASTVPTP